MLNVFVEHFRGIRLAEIQAARIALICGPNEQGKSSVIDAVRCVLDGNTKPYGLTQKQIEDRLLYNDTVGSLVEVKADGRGMSMKFPSAELSTEGRPFRTTRLVTGSERFMDLNDRDRAQALSRYLKTGLDKDDLIKALEPIDFTKDEIDAIWSDCQKQGDDGAWELHREQGTKLKGAWEKLAGEKYGSDKGRTWRPRGWTNDHELLKDQEIADEIATAKEAVEAAIGKVAINDDEKKRLEALCKNIPKLKEMAETRRKAQERADANLKTAEDALKKIPIIPDEHWPKCPHCQKAVKITGKNELQVAPAPMDGAERQKIELQLEEAQRIFDTAMAARTTAATEYQTAADDLLKAERGKASLENSDPAAITPAALQQLRDDQALWEGIQFGKNKVQDALRAHMAIVQKIDLVKVLAPEGLRKTKLASKLEAFNERLEQLCEIAGWDMVTMTPENKLEMNGKPYVLCARSGRMRCDATLQVAFAELDGSEIILIDDAEALDGDGRNGLFALLQHSERYALVGMMLIKSKEAPDLRKAKIGATFWIQGAEAQELCQKLAAA